MNDPGVPLSGEWTTRTKLDGSSPLSEANIPWKRRDAGI